MSSREVERTVVVGKKRLSDYLIEIAVLFQEAGIVVLRGEGRFISKAVDLYNVIKYKMGDSVELVNVSIGSSKTNGRVRPYIVIKIRRR